MRQKTIRTKFSILAIVAGVMVSGLFFVLPYVVRAYVGPPCSPGGCSGAIGSDSSNNISVGTSTTTSTTKFLVIGSSSDATTYAVKFLENNLTPIFLLRDDGTVTISTSTATTTIAGNLTVGGVFTATTYGGSVTAGNVSAGTFGSNFGGGGYTFSGGTLTVNETTTLASSTIFPLGIWNASGNVGIGTTSPDFPLSVNGSMDVGNSAGTGAYFAKYFNAGATFYVGLDNSAGSDFGNAYGAVIGNYSNTPMSFITNSAERMRILANGNVGIGTTSPTTPLMVVGTTTVNGNVSSTGLCLGGTCNTTWPTGNAGTVTSVATNNGLTGGTITGAGTIGIASGGVTFAMWASNSCSTNQIPKWNGSAWACAADANSGGTVTSVATGAGLSGGTITGSGTLTLDLTHANSWSGAQTFGTATTTFNANMDMPGTGIWNTSGDVGIGTMSVDSNYILTLASGGIKSDVGSSANPAGYFNNTGSGAAIQIGSGGLTVGAGGITVTGTSTFNGNVTSSGLCLGGTCKTTWPTGNAGTVTSVATNNGLTGGTITGAGTIGIASGGVTFDMWASNSCSTNQIPKWNGSAWACAADANSGGTVTSIVAGTGLTGGTITGTGTLALNTASSTSWSGAQTFTGGLTVSTLASTFNTTTTFNAKMTVTTVDPVYGINGINYATYLPAMTGEKEETAGLLDLSCAQGAGGVCSSTIDFNNLTQGSDVWLFSKATNLPSDIANLIVVLTPSFDGKAWYKKNIATGVLTIYGDQAGEVSYRFTAPRFDAAQWSNLAPADEKPGFIIK